MKRLTVGMYALHYVLYLCTLNKSRLAGAASLTLLLLHLIKFHNYVI